VAYVRLKLKVNTLCRQVLKDQTGNQCGVWNKLDVPYNEYLRLNRQLKAKYWIWAAVSAICTLLLSGKRLLGNI